MQLSIKILQTFLLSQKTDFGFYLILCVECEFQVYAGENSCGIWFFGWIKKTHEEV